MCFVLLNPVVGEAEDDSRAETEGMVVLLENEGVVVCLHLRQKYCEDANMMYVYVRVERGHGGAP